MKIRITDIPPEGLNIDCELDRGALNERLAQAEQTSNSKRSPTYRFGPKPNAHLKLELEGSTVNVSGELDAEFVTGCSRCAEDVNQDISRPIKIVLKPRPSEGRNGEQDEDLSIAFHNGVDVDTNALVEDFLILALPYSVLCSANCKGLCPHCGKNLNNGSCDCTEAQISTSSPFSVLKQLKLNPKQ